MADRQIEEKEKSSFIKELKDNDKTYYYGLCKGKVQSSSKKNKDYSEGWMMLISSQESCGFYFYKTNKKESQVAYTLNERKYVDTQEISSVYQDQQKLIIKYSGQNFLHLKFKGLQIVEQWRQTINNYRRSYQQIVLPNNKIQAIQSKEKIDENKGLDQTKQSQSYQKSRKQERIQAKEQVKTQQLHKVCQVRISQLQQQLRIQKGKNQQLSIRYAEFQAVARSRQKELQAQIAENARKLTVKQHQLEQIISQKQDKGPQMEAQEKINQLTEQLARLKRGKHKQEQEIKYLKKQAQSHQQQIQLIITSHLFHGEILHEDHYRHKQYLKQQIEEYTNRSIYISTLIYKFDGKNKINFHHYFDGKANIVLLVALSNGNLLAAYSESPFSKEDDASDKGLIMSLTNRITFKCRPGKRSVSYDQYYICFGNSQIRIQAQQNMVFSNFGISNGYYASNGCKLDVLLGQNSKEVDLDYYQLYQISFH